MLVKPSPGSVWYQNLLGSLLGSNASVTKATAVPESKGKLGWHPLISMKVLVSWVSVSSRKGFVHYIYHGSKSHVGCPVDRNAKIDSSLPMVTTG